jgi:hypothetical protein
MGLRALAACLPWLVACAAGEALGAEAIRDDRLRAEALRRARVWSDPAVPIPSADLGSSPPEPSSFRASDELSCRFRQMRSHGRSPKFQCVLADGEVIKVKYGRDNPEVFAEVAASRLLSALGFGADRMYVVARVRCSGCPLFPYPRYPWLDGLFANRSLVRTFDWVVIERPAPGVPIEGANREGWEWRELDATDAAAGGASPAQREALRLMAVFLSHWDGKAENHRLVCPESEGGDPSAPCAEPLALIHDLGKTFGPRGVDLENWVASPIWKHAPTCRVSMESLPYRGASFGEASISEDGRLFLARLLEQLGESQIRDLFTGARFQDHAGSREAGHTVDDWVFAFRRRSREIVGRPPCPSGND